MFPFMCLHIDQLSGFLISPESGVHCQTGVTDKGDNGTIMIGVHFTIEQYHSAFSRDGIANRIDHFRTATFRKIRHTLY
jgi:hypothetical protein